MNPTVLVNADGEGMEPHGSTAKQIMFDWSGVFAVGMAAITWGYYSNKLETLGSEVARLRASDAARVEDRVTLAREMATKADITSLRSDIQALAVEMRARTNK